jgi:hypothetical protein
MIEIMIESNASAQNLPRSKLKMSSLSYEEQEIERLEKEVFIFDAQIST